MKRILALGIILLFIGLSLSSSTGFNIREQSNTLSSNGKTLYVGGSGPNNYTKIQDAIDNASDGNTVFVYDGTYYENVVVNKSINLIGEDKDTTIIDGNKSYSPVIRIDADFVNVSEFAIQNGYYYGIDILSGKNSITDNIIKDNRWGIWIWGYLYGSSNNSIIKNIIKLNKVGIWLNYTAYNNTILQNDIYSNSRHGVCLETPAHYNKISNNTISNHSYSGVSVSSTFNVISCNVISNNTRGIDIANKSNEIYENLLIDNENGIRIEHWHKSINNSIYHNNFINNTNQAYDEGNNTWDDGYPSGGNYWDDYTGNDSDGDGIGDTPYPIPGGDNEDRYPLMEPWSDVLPYARFIWTPKYPKPGTTILFNASKSYDPDGFIILYEWDWDNDGEFDENHTIPTTTHSWTIGGSYSVTLRVTDNSTETGKKTRTLTVNSKPNEPAIDGPTYGKVGVKYNYTIVAVDPEGDNVTYYISWGDSCGGHEWHGPYPSGEEKIVAHRFSSKSTFIINLMAVDEHGAESNWTYLEVTIPKNKQTIVNRQFLHWLERFPLLNKIIMRIMERWGI